MRDERVYFIRPTTILGDVDPPGARTPETVRRSLDGKLCVLVYPPGAVPDAWDDGMSADQVRALLQGPEGLGVWYLEEF